MVQAANLRDRDHLATFGWFDLTSNGRVAIERKMRPSLVVIYEIRGENAPEMTFVQYDDMPQALSPNRADQALDEWTLPGRTVGGDDLLDAHVFDALPELASVDGITIADEETRRLVPWERFNDLLASPFRCRMGRHVEVNNVTALVAKNDERTGYET